MRDGKTASKSLRVAESGLVFDAMMAAARALTGVNQKEI